VVGFINDHRTTYGVESICRMLPIAHPRITGIAPGS
jgi:hypothetical protein